MTQKTRSFHETRSDLLIGLLTVILYSLLLAAFFICLSVPNIYLRHLNRTVASTLLTFFISIVATNAIYGGFDVGRKKSKPVIAAMIAGTLLTDLVSYVQLEIMNVNANHNSHLVLFGRDLLYLLLCIAIQIPVIIIFVRLGNTLYFRMHPPRSVLLVLGGPEQENDLRSKLSRYALQWKVTQTALYSDPALEELIAKTDVVFLGSMPETAKAVLLKTCYDHRKDIMCKSQLQEVLLSNARSAVVDDAVFLDMEFYKMSFFQRLIKRIGDILISLFFLIVLSPLMALISVAVKAEDGGPVIFRQKRITLRGREFEILKFRTMTPNASAHDIQVSSEEDDPRITKVGRILRRLRLDELPQFVNILAGQMSLVGPRPEMIANVERYKAELPGFAYREKMKAGLTGYAQIEGRYNTTAEDKLMLDLMYIESFSVWLDIKLILRTVTVFFKKDSTEGFTKAPADHITVAEEEEK